VRDYLCIGEVVKDLFGWRVEQCAALCIVVDICFGRFDGEPEINQLH